MMRVEPAVPLPLRYTYTYPCTYWLWATIAQGLGPGRGETQGYVLATCAAPRGCCATQRNGRRRAMCCCALPARSGCLPARGRPEFVAHMVPCNGGCPALSTFSIGRREGTCVVVLLHVSLSYYMCRCPITTCMPQAPSVLSVSSMNRCRLCNAFASAHTPPRSPVACHRCCASPAQPLIIPHGLAIHAHLYIILNRMPAQHTQLRPSQPMHTLANGKACIVHTPHSSLPKAAPCYRASNCTTLFVLFLYRIR